ncbi:hypothetical protein ACIA8K_23445 [Catenuloplanes sp. NPDC051500]|uniref:hypothetical protein n=1 Tax=Catenuloplanes sp. NPDC051500 TaxID=3363959 RepID=UPI00379FAB20
MSRTDKTQPWWVQIADAPMVACRPVHDHRFGECTLPAEITRETTLFGGRREGCYWGLTDSFVVSRVENFGYRESYRLRREERRRDRHQARRALHDYCGED